MHTPAPAHVRVDTNPFTNWRTETGSKVGAEHEKSHWLTSTILRLSNSVSTLNIASD